MTLNRLLFVCVASISVLLAASRTDATVPPSVDKNPDAQLSFDAIVFLARLSEERRLVTDSSLYERAVGLEERMLLTFDADNSEEALQLLVRLHYYYIGEGPGEIYECIVARKGNVLVPLLVRERGKLSDDCVENLGRANRVCLRSRVSQRVFAESLELLTKAAKEHQKCDLD